MLGSFDEELAYVHTSISDFFFFPSNKEKSWASTAGAFGIHAELWQTHKGHRERNIK